MKKTYEKENTNYYYIIHFKTKRDWKMVSYLSVYGNTYLNS